MAENNTDEFGEFVETKSGDEFGDFVSTEKKNASLPDSTTPVSQPTTPSSASGTVNLPPITLGEETLRAGQATGDVIQQPLRDEASYQKGRVESMEASRREMGKKLEEDIAKQLKDKTEKEKQAGIKEKLLTYLKNFVGEQTGGGGTPMVTEQEDLTPINAFKTFDIQIEELEPYKVREEGVDEGLRKSVLMENFKLQKAIKRDREQLLPYLQNIKTVADAKKLFGETSAEYQALTEGLKADEAKLKIDYENARKVNAGKLQEMGFLESFGEGIQQTHEANEVANALYSDNEERFGELLERNYTKNFLYGDQKRSDLGQLLGGQAMPIGVTFTAAVLSGGNPAMAGIAGTGYYARLGAGSEAIQVYNEARSQGKTHAEATALAKGASKAGFVAGGVEGALGSTFAVGELAKGAMKLSKPAVKAIFSAAADAGVDAGAAVGAQYYKNTEAIKQGIERDEFEGLAEEGAAEAVFGLGFQILSKGASKLKTTAPKVYSQLIAQYGKVRPDITNGTIDQAIQSGEISPDAGQQLKTDLAKSYTAQQKLEGVEIPEEKQAEVVQLQTRIDDLEAQKENASPAVLPAIEKQIEDTSAELQIAAGIGLNSQEKGELNKLQTARDENKAYDKDRLKVLEKRQEAFEMVGKENANAKAKELGYSSATHLLNKVKKEGLGEYETVQEVPQEVLEQLNKNKPPMPEAETEGEIKTEEDATNQIEQQEGVSAERESGSEVGQTDKAISSDSIQREAAGAEEGQVAEVEPTEQVAEEVVTEQQPTGETVTETEAVEATPEIDTFTRASDKKIRMAERDGSLDEDIMQKTEQKAKPNIQSAKERLAAAKAKQKQAYENLGIDPIEQKKNQAQADRDVFDAYVELAKEYIKEGIQSVKDFAAELGEDVNDLMNQAWTEAVAGGGVKRTFLTKRAYEGKLREDTKRQLERQGLTREIESQDEALARAKSFVEEVGNEAALEAVRNGDVRGGEATAIWGTVLENIDKQIASAKSEEEARALNEMQGALMGELDRLLTEGGRAAAMMNKIYQESDLGYNLQRKIQEYKDANDGVIPADVEAKFREWDNELKEVKKKLAEAEQRAKEAEEKAAVGNIKEAVEREKKIRKPRPAVYGKTRVAKGIDDLASALGVKLSAVGQERASITQALTDIGQGLIEAGVATTENVAQKIREYIREKFGDKINFDDYEADVVGNIANANTKGDLKIPNSIIRDLVEQGIDNIEDLTAAVKEAIKDQYPNATDRQVRDAITGYGKTVNPNRDEVSLAIRKMKRIGRILSGLEDVANKKRPLRSGQQRDKLDAEERALQKELREAMKELPVEEADLEAQLKTSLDAVKQRLQNQIEDLNREIESGEKTPVSERKIEYDAEAKALAEERDRVKAIHDEIFGKTELTDEQRINIATKALEKSISNLEEKLKTGDILPKSVESKTPETPELKALREKRDKLQEEIQELRDATKVKKSPQEIATENAIEANRKSIEEKERRIRENDLSPTPKKEVADKNNAELKALRTKNEALDKQLQKLRNDAKVKRDASIVATEAAIKSIERRTKEIQDRIKKNELEKAKKPSLVKNTPEYQKAKEKLEVENEKLKKLQEAAGLPNKKRIELAKKAAQRRIEDLEKRLREGDFSKKERKPIIEDTELTKLRAEKLRIQEKYDKEFYKAKLLNRTRAEKAKDALWDLWNIPRLLMATAEASFVGIQGVKLSLAHPMQAAQAFKNSWKAFKSEENAEKFLNEIKSQEWYPVMKKSKLALTEPKAEMQAREELFYSGWTDMIWDYLGKLIVSPTKFKGEESFKSASEGWNKLNPFKAFERASVGYLDTLRVLRFLDGMEMLEMQGKTFDKNPQDYKDVADAVNTLTGRASLGAAEQIAPTLSKVFFSPRNWASGIKTATPYAFYHFGKMTPTARKMAVADLSKFLGLTTGMMAMAAATLNNDDDDETNVELDPRSSDFMKIRLGNTRIDPWGGTQQQVVMSTRIIADALMKAIPSLGIEGAYKKGDEVLPMGIRSKTPTAGKVLGQQALNKLNPTASLIYNYLNTTRKKDGTIVNDYGKEYTLKGELEDKFYPIFWGTVAELFKEDPSALDGLLSFYAFFGGGVSIYDSKPKK